MSTDAFAGIEPKEIWKHFAALTAIPRGSGNEAAVRQHIQQFAQSLGLSASVDARGNLIVRKPAVAGREQAPVAALQGHLDMVCEKNEATVFNFATDALHVLREGDWLRADGTTLGADNGVGVATAMAVMESKTIQHGPLEFVFTIEEETTLGGASGFAAGQLKARYLLNLDSEERAVLCIGCAGGLNSRATRQVALRAAKATAAFTIKVQGLHGGHSGIDIHLGRGNAIRILGGVLQVLQEKLYLELADIKGGSAHNAIPREAAATVYVDVDDEQKLRDIVAAYAADVRADLGAFDAGLQIAVAKIATLVEGATTPRVLAAEDAARVIDLLASLPHGVLAMSPDVPGLVQDSTNLATVALTGDTVEIVTSQRSSLESGKELARRLVATACRLAGFEVTHGAGYPGWKPQPDNEIVKLCKTIFAAQLGQEPKVVAMHAGLETGVLGQKYPELQMISFGPQIEHPHSPAERVQISTVAEFWQFLQTVLEKL